MLSVFLFGSMLSFREPDNVKALRHRFAEQVKQLKHPTMPDLQTLHQRCFYKALPDMSEEIGPYYDFSKRIGEHEWFLIAGFYIGQGNTAGIFARADSQEVMFYDYDHEDNHTLVKTCEFEELLSL